MTLKRGEGGREALYLGAPRRRAVVVLATWPRPGPGRMA